MELNYDVANHIMFNNKDSQNMFHIMSCLCCGQQYHNSSVYTEGILHTKQNLPSLNVKLSASQNNQHERIYCYWKSDRKG